MPKRIPIAAARRFARQHDLTAIVILGYEADGRSHVLTCGKSLDQSIVAAELGNQLKKQLQWPDALCQAMPARAKCRSGWREAARRLVAVARAAWALCDGTEGTAEKDEFGEPCLRVPEDLHKALSKSLDRLDELPELPTPYVGEGPAKAAHLLGVEPL